MTTLREGELLFSFPEDVRAERLDLKGRQQPKGMSLVDFVLESADETVLIEVKDPSAKRTSQQELGRNVRRMTGKELTHDILAPKARDSYTYLHLMGRDDKPFQFLVVLGIEKLPIEPPLLLNLRDRLVARLAKETNEPWVRQYVADCHVVKPDDLHKVLPGCRVERIVSDE